MKYTLINPVIAGSFSKTYEADNENDAAQMFWEALAVDGKYISGNVPKFLFTMKEEGTSDSKLHHFVVSETPDDKSASYSIKKLDLKLTQSETNNLVNASANAYDTAHKLARNYQEGGSSHKKHKRHGDDDSSSSSSDSSDDDLDEMFKSIRIKSVIKPIVYWWYTPTVYKVENIFTPTFVPSVTPLYTQLWIPLP